jgi:hypothetical protein
LTTSLQVGVKYLGWVVCRFHVAAGAGSAPCQKPVSINLQKWFLSPTGQLNFGFTIEKNLPLCSSHLPLGVPNWSVNHAPVVHRPTGSCRPKRHLPPPAVDLPLVAPCPLLVPSAYPLPRPVPLSALHINPFFPAMVRHHCPNPNSSRQGAPHPRHPCYNYSMTPPAMPRPPV